MRVRLVSIAAYEILSTGISNAQVEVVVPEAGRVKTTAKVENGVLGIVNSYTRLRSTGRERDGHKTRTGCAALLIAISTALDGNPSVNARRIRGVTAPVLTKSPDWPTVPVA